MLRNAARENKLFFTVRRERDMLSPSVCLSVRRQKPMFCRNEGTDHTGFWHEGFL